MQGVKSGLVGILNNHKTYHLCSRAYVVVDVMNVVLVIKRRM